MANKYLLTYGKEWYYLTGIMSKHNGNFYYFNCLHSFRTKNKFKSHKKVCENWTFCVVAMPSKDQSTPCKNKPENHPQQKQVNIFHRDIHV